MLVEVLVHIGLLLVTSKLLEAVFSRVGLSSIFAYVTSGVLLGPVLGLVEPSDEPEIVLSVGIFVLFFVVGLDEIDVPGFIATIRGRFFAAAIVSVAISTVAALMVTSDLFGLSFTLGLEFKNALALAGVLSMSSLGIVAKVLHDGGHLKEPIGLKIFTVVIIAEVVVLLMVGFNVGEHHRELTFVSLAVLFGKMAAFVVASWLLSKRLLPPVINLLERFLKVPELSFGLLFGGLFLMVAAAEEMELHGSIGALLFGTALSGLPQRVRREVMPGMRSAAEGLFLPLFFAAAGLNFDLSFTGLPPATIAAVMLIPLAGKLAGALIGTIVARVDSPLAIGMGLMAKGVAEIAFLLVLFEDGVIERDVFSLLVLTMFGYILFMPMLIEFAVNRAKAPDRDAPSPAVPPLYSRFVLEGIRTSAVVDIEASYPHPETTVKHFADNWTVPGQADYLVVDEEGIAGVASIMKLHALPRSQWSSTLLSEVLHRDVPQAWDDEPLDEVLERMVENSLTVIPVVARHSGEFLGTVTHQEVLDLLMLLDDIADELAQRGEAEP